MSTNNSASQQQADRGRPVSPEERQAASTLKAAKEVAVEIERLKNRIRNDGASARLRQEARADLFEATERLCNLMALAMFQLTSRLSSDFASVLNQGFQEVRHRLMHMGVHLMVERLEKVHERAREVVDGGAYPVGMAMRLHAVYVELTNNLTALQAESMLTEEQQKLILDTAAMLNKLAGLEEHIGMVLELSQDPERDLPSLMLDGRGDDHL
jgi:hypothetical protein